MSVAIEEANNKDATIRSLNKELENLRTNKSILEQQ